ncbi:MAG: tetraacyldisaccharide 4'-kinase, partial [Burkholderiales bacterium]
MSRWLERNWARVTAATFALYPLSLLFRALVALRRAAYARGLMQSIRLPVRVIIVGNISVGGTGKTPLVLWLATFLKSHGYNPGIVSRGYGARNREPRPVAAAADPLRFGDEPVLLAQRTTAPVWVGADRVAATLALLAAHAECDVVLSDDGLQHYRLARDVEIAVLDGARALGNGLMLPAGALREPASRLMEVDAVVVNGSLTTQVAAATLFTMNLEGRQF